MTSLRKRLSNILTEVSIISKEIYSSGQGPPCCLTFHGNDLVSCDALGPLPKKDFFLQCAKCKAGIKGFIDGIVRENTRASARA